MANVTPDMPKDAYGILAAFADATVATRWR